MQNKIQTISNLFEGREIRSIWDIEKRLGESVVTSDNKLDYSYIDDKLLEDLK